MTITKQMKSGANELYDESLGYDDETGVKVASNLNYHDRERAVILYRLFNELWGLCIVTGDPGSGKDLFGNYLSFTLKRFFPWKRILRDERPRRVYGMYAGLFNEEVISNDLAKMKAITKGITKENEVDIVLDKAADDWVSGAGEVMLKNSVLYLTELWRYCYNREPHNPMNKTMGAIFKVKRHLDCLTIGTVQLPSELDKKTCLPWVDWKVTCARKRDDITKFAYLIQKVKYDRRVDSLIPLGKAFPIAIDAGKPRNYIGDGNIIIKKPDYEPQNEEERVVMEVLKSGVHRYHKLITTIEDYGDMLEDEILVTLKNLKFNRNKRVIDYPCFFSLYNSKSAVSIDTNLKVEE